MHGGERMVYEERIETDLQKISRGIEGLSSLFMAGFESICRSVENRMAFWLIQLPFVFLFSFFFCFNPITQVCH